MRAVTWFQGATEISHAVPHPIDRNRGWWTALCGRAAIHSDAVSRAKLCKTCRRALVSRYNKILS